MDDKTIKKIKENMTKGLVEQNYTEWMMVRGDEGVGKTCRGCDEPITVRDSSLSYLATSGSGTGFTTNATRVERGSAESPSSRPLSSVMADDPTPLGRHRWSPAPHAPLPALRLATVSFN